MSYIGHPFNTALQYGTETTYGTEVATTTAIGKITNFTPVKNNNMMISRGVGEGRNATTSLWGIFDCGGTIDYELHDFTFLKYWIGPQAGSGTSGSPYTLTESAMIGTTSSTDILPFSLEVGDEEGAADDVDTYVGCVGNNFTLSGSIGNPITASATFVARTYVPSETATAYTAPSTPPWMYQQAQYKYGTTPSAVVKVQNWTISMNNKLFTYRDGERFISKPEPGLRDYTWGMTLIMTDAQKAAFQNAADGGASGPVTGVTNAEYTSNEELHILLAEGTSAGQRQAEIKLDQCWINDTIKSISLGDDLVLIVCNGGAKSSLSNVFVTWWTN